MCSQKRTQKAAEEEYNGESIERFTPE